MRMTAEQYYLNEIATKAKDVIDLLGETAKQTARIADLEAQLKKKAEKKPK